MELALTEEQQMIQATARQFAETELTPTAAALDEHEGRGSAVANTPPRAFA